MSLADVQQDPNRCVRCGHLFDEHLSEENGGCSAMMEVRAAIKRFGSPEEEPCACPDFLFEEMSHSLRERQVRQRLFDDWTGRIVQSGFVGALSMRDLDAVDTDVLQLVVSHAEAVHRLRRELREAEDQLREAMADAQEDLWS